MTSDRTRPGSAATIVALAMIAAGASSQAPSTRQTLEFSQQKVRANMQEVEERMFRVAGLLREAQPESSARLVLGLKRSREELIVAEMEDVRSLISRGKLEEAVERQRVVLVKLEELRRLLLSSDLDLILKLERLRQLTRVGKALSELRKEEERQAAVLDKIADEAAGEQNKLRLDAAREAAEEAARKLDDAAAAAKDAMNRETGVQEDLDGARRDQEASRKDLSEGQTKSAAGRKRKAGKGLSAASSKVSSAREALIEELQDAIRAAVIDALTQMVQHQEKVSSGMAPAGGDLSAVRYESLRDLERGVVDLARSTRDIVEETEFSVALPVSLRLIETSAASCAAALAAAHIDGEARRVSARVLDDLKALLKILDEEAAGAQRAGRPSAGGCKGCADRNKLISELSMVRLLEVGLREDTRAVESRRGQPADETLAEIQKAVLALAERQQRTGKATDSLRKRSCSKCLRGENE